MALDDQHTVSLLHFDGNLTDESGKEWTPYGSTLAYADQGKFGAAVKLSGQDQCLRCTDVPAFLTNPFSVDLNFAADVINSKEHYLFSSGYAGNGSTLLYIASGTVYVTLTNQNGSSVVNNLVVGTISTVGAFNHFYLGRMGSVVYAALNGNIVTANISASDSFTATVWEIGYAVARAKTTAYAKGVMDEFRMSNVVRWTQPFSPPTAPYGIKKSNQLASGGM